MAQTNMGTQLVIALAFVAAALLHGTAANIIVVGDTAGWVVPSNTSFYATWASNKTFKVNDTLVFNFTTGKHNVATVTKDAYDACNTANAGEILTSGPANVTLNNTGQHYFICQFPEHCIGGQKLSINVANTENNTPTTTAPPPPPNSASSHGYGVTLSVILMFIAVALFC